MKDMRPALLLFLVLTVICGGIYPAAVTGIARVFFPQQAAGSLVHNNKGAPAGSALIGQPFSEPKYFWPRPSATGVFPYNPAASGGSNSGATNAAFLAIVEKRVKLLRDSGVTGTVPADLVLASASGLDPHVSLAAATVQIPRVALARGLKPETVEKLVAQATEGPQLGFIGATRVNVLALNLTLDSLKP